jgi:hypothetical protein
VRGEGGLSVSVKLDYFKAREKEEERRAAIRDNSELTRSLM